MKYKPKFIDERFSQRYNINTITNCWEWNGTQDRLGYGSLYIGRDPRFEPRTHGAHRVSYILHTGDIPEGLYILHHCDNPCCVNPDHLYAGTQQDNMNDMKNRNRQGGGRRPLNEEERKSYKLASRKRAQAKWLAKNKDHRQDYMQEYYLNNKERFKK